MDMASLPSTKPKSSLSKRDLKIISLLMQGHKPHVVAQKLAPDSAAKRRALVREMRRMMATSEEFKVIQAAIATGAMHESLPEITDALIKRAKRGRTDAIKLIFEATSFHNPRVKHEHSGDITIKLAIPRPVATHGEDEAGPGKNVLGPGDEAGQDVVDIPEADVVEEG